MNVFKKLLSATYLPWLLLLACSDLFFTFLVWLANPDALRVLVPVILLFGLILFSSIFFFVQYRLRRQHRSMVEFLKNPAPESLQQVLSTQVPALYPAVRDLLEHVLWQAKALEDDRAQLLAYQEFIEEWTHNIKTPLSLFTLVLDNHKEEMSPYVYQRMTHVRQEIQTDVDMILYYARLEAAHVEYLFETIRLPELIKELVQNYQEQMEETGILIETNCPDITLVSDRKVLTFILSQILNNAFQYTPHEGGKIYICGWSEAASSVFHLAVRDNGHGVPAEDVPFLFDKGFTGNHPDRQNATGMGLYLVAKYAEALAVEVHVETELTDMGQDLHPDMDFRTGFGIELIFYNINLYPRASLNACPCGAGEPSGFVNV